MDNTTNNCLTTENTVIENVENTSLASLNIGFGNNLNEALNKMGSRGKATPTGIISLDKAINGGLRPGLTLLAAAPGSCKTTMALEIAEYLSNGGRQVIYFSNDMAYEELLAKGISRNSHELFEQKAFSTIEVLNHSENNLKDSQFFKTACETYKQRTANLRFETISSFDFNALKLTLSTYIGKFAEPPIIFIDYLQKVFVDDGNTDKEKLDFLSAQLKAFSNENNLIIFAISTVNRTSYLRELTMDSLKETGGLEYNSDVILAIQFKGVGDPTFKPANAKKKDIWNMELLILKQRLGTSDVKIPINIKPKYNHVINSLENNTKRKKTSDFIHI